MFYYHLIQFIVLFSKCLMDTIKIKLQYPILYKILSHLIPFN